MCTYVMCMYYTAKVHFTLINMSYTVCVLEIFLVHYLYKLRLVPPGFTDVQL